MSGDSKDSQKRFQFGGFEAIVGLAIAHLLIPTLLITTY